MWLFGNFFEVVRQGSFAYYNQACRKHKIFKVCREEQAFWLCS